MSFRFIFLVLGTILFARVCPAEVQVSVSITGTMEEMADVLEKLRELGIGGGGGDAMQLELQSTMTSSSRADVPSAPKVALTEPTLSPETAPPTGRVLLMVDVTDETAQIDTVAATVDVANLSVDLYDNGTNGDAKQGDGVWSGILQTPDEMAPGEYRILFQAYDARGQAVQGDTLLGPMPVAAEAKLIVVEESE